MAIAYRVSVPHPRVDTANLTIELLHARDTHHTRSRSRTLEITTNEYLEFMVANRGLMLDANLVNARPITLSTYEPYIGSYFIGGTEWHLPKLNTPPWSYCTEYTDYSYLHVPV